MNIDLDFICDKVESHTEKNQCKKLELPKLVMMMAKPKKISEILQQIIALQPEIIFYGISYSEFYISNENKLFEFFSLFLFKQEKIAYSIIL